MTDKITGEDVRALDAAVEEARLAAESDTVREAVKHPTFANAMNAAEDPAVQGLLEDLPYAFAEAKAGYKTTEFWLALGGVFSAQTGALSLPGEHGTTIATIAFVVAYVLSRGVAKAGVPAAPSA